MKKYIFLFAGLWAFNLAFAQTEICDDGIDNDGDGFIDCFDPDCANSGACDGFYIGNDASCEAVPGQFPTFSLTLDFASENKTANHIGRMAIGDLDRDGIPEIATQNRYTDKVFLLNGDDGSTKFQADINSPRWRISMANVEDDNCGEVFAVSYRNRDYKIVAFDCELNQIWESENREEDPVHLGYADFDHDGLVEMYYKDEIRDPVDGTRLVQGDDNNWDDINGGPVAVNILGDDDLELVSGGTIYSVNLGSRTADGGSLTEVATMPGGYSVRREESATSIADYNLDGFLDVIVAGEDASGIATVFFWDVQNNNVLSFNDPLPAAVTGSNDYLTGWVNGMGRLNIGDLDGDGQLNVSFVSGRYLYALDENFNLFWRVVINEETSGYTGCTLFDFNGDGKTEVVYRDEQWLYIINGDDGSVFTQVRCISRTNVEYPIVADVDADGSTELCVTCGFDDNDAWANFYTLSYSENSHVRIYKSGGEPWVPARRLWNQHGYFNVNINDDLSVPQFQQDHHLIWSTGTCTVGPNRPLNNFLNQSPFLNSEGCPTYPAPDVAFIDNSLVIDQPDCPDTDFTISFDFTNIGDVKISGPISISIYNGDPTQAGAIILTTTTVNVNQFGIGDIESVINLPITGPGSPFTLYVVLNDNGTTVPTPISLPNTNFLECNYDNNIILGDVIPNPFLLSTEVTDNIVCAGSTVPDNGSARAFRLVGGIENTTDYDFFWFNGTDATGTADYVGAIYSGLAAGTYSVFALHKTAQCNSDTVQVVVQDIPTTVDAVITVEAPFTNCNNPDGRLSVQVNGGEPVGNFDYEWYVGNTVGGGLQISNSHIANNLAPGVYTVLVTEKTTGCQDIQSAEVPDNAMNPVVNATAIDITCSNLNAGEVSADVGGVTAGFTFNWYSGPSVKPTPDFSGDTQTNLAQGIYTVVAIDDNTTCESAPVSVTINQTVPPIIASITSTDMTSCDASQLNGTATITFAGDPTQFTVEWYRGQNTNTVNLLGTGETINQLDQGIYTAKLIDINTGCFDTEEVTVNDNVVIPTLSVTKVDVTICAPFNGGVTASVSSGNITDYTFSWYEGTSVKATPDFSDTDESIEGLAPGFYTVSAVNNATNCQVAGPATIEVLDASPTINITQTVSNIIPPSDCNNNQGDLTIEVSRAGNSSGFELEWYEGSFPFTGNPIQTLTSTNPVTTDGLSGIPAGVYSVLARDLDTGCESIEEFDMEFLNAHVININAIDVTDCAPENGQLEIELNSRGLDHGDFIIEIYEGTNVTGSPVITLNGTAGVTANTTYSTTADLIAQDYTAVAINTAINDCESAPKTATVNFNTVAPAFTINPTANMNCTGFDGSATIAGLANPAFYDINWFEGQDIAGASIGTGTSLNNLAPGTYAVEIVTTNSAAPSGLGCSAVQFVTIANDAPITTIGVAAVNVTDCSPVDGSLNNGSASAIVFEDGVDVTASYTLTYTDEAGNVINENNLSPGRYFVTGTNGTNGCDVQTEFEIVDDTMNDPLITLINSQNPTQCSQPVNLLGELEVEATGGGASYSYNWYAGTNPTGPVISANAQLVGQNAGEYTVEAINNTTNCRSTENYELVLVIDEITAAASATPETNCAVPDGGVFAVVTSGSPANYDYNWTNSAGDPVGSGREVLGLPTDTYTVTIVDQADAACTTTQLVNVDNGIIFPNVMVQEIAPMSVCDENFANGAARATVDGGFIGYTFEWFEGTDTSVPPVFTGPEFSGLSAATYTVRATDNFTQCISEASVTISSDIQPVIDPFIEVLSHDISCLEDVGALAVSINGNTSNYIFDWYMGTTVSGSPILTGEVLSGLTSGLYTVVATSRITGCVSNPVTGEILELLDYPDFVFDIGNANCDEENGFVKLILTNDVEVDRIVWRNLTDTSFPDQVGPNLTEAPAGIYEVTASSSNGCETVREVEIKTEVTPFNGVSRNNDGSNDFFRIDCISNFPDNIVKIFNRAGTLVFEAEGYDNASRVFDGNSNKGISPIGVNLPDGTYFYVIDKKDGSKPISGYLELVD